MLLTRGRQQLSLRVLSRTSEEINVEAFLWALTHSTRARELMPAASPPNLAIESLWQHRAQAQPHQRVGSADLALETRATLTEDSNTSLNLKPYTLVCIRLAEELGEAQII